jgi:hypothetical protein
MSSRSRQISNPLLTLTIMDSDEAVVLTVLFRGRYEEDMLWRSFLQIPFV